ncbi:hypothetical protein PSECIP111854_04055 [Pseudoalteromonas sp. CIP111854]|uniref:Uncharacterized protein n=1 Tax=Pseudoalteromonas holothuriae TaxID=2963714 RepID=A0A9W4W3N0_9GAMM|nr:hypothetical protein [Pseudoalteromonas sp. CIP111854]CAH9067247.1 hypothetical protein PSECIP111854_04055 [Pseudoalteromonas sp. CIP111854]
MTKSTSGPAKTGRLSKIKTDLAKRKQQSRDKALKKQKEANEASKASIQSELANSLGKKPDDITASDIDKMIKDAETLAKESNGHGGVLDGFLGALINALLKFGSIDLGNDDDFEKYKALLDEIKGEVMQRDSDNLKQVENNINRVEVLQKVTGDVDSADALVEGEDTENMQSIRTAVEAIEQSVSTLSEDGTLHLDDVDKLEQLLTQVDNLETAAYAMNDDDLSSYYDGFAQEIKQRIYAAAGFNKPEDYPAPRARTEAIREKIQAGDTLEGGTRELYNSATQLKESSDAVFKVFDRVQSKESDEQSKESDEQSKESDEQSKESDEQSTESDEQSTESDEQKNAEPPVELTPEQQAERLKQSMDSMLSTINKVKPHAMNVSQISESIKAIDDVSRQLSDEQKARLLPLHNAMMNLKKSLQNLVGASLPTYQQTNRQGAPDGQPEGSPEAAQNVNESRERLKVEIDKANDQLVDKLPSTFELKANLNKTQQDTSALATLFAKSYLEVVNTMASLPEGAPSQVGASRLRKNLTKLTSLNESDAKGLDEASLSQVISNNLNGESVSAAGVAELSDALEQFIELAVLVQTRSDTST